MYVSLSVHLFVATMTLITAALADNDTLNFFSQSLHWIVATMPLITVGLAGDDTLNYQCLSLPLHWFVATTPLITVALAGDDTELSVSVSLSTGLLLQCHLLL